MTAALPGHRQPSSEGLSDLVGATLYGANLYGATADKTTVWPEGFDPEAAGVIFE